MAYGYMAQNQETKKYTLGLKLLQISSGILANLGIREIAEDYLEDLQEKSGEIIHLYVFRDGKMTCISKVGNPRGLTLSSFVGWTTEPHGSGAGKTLVSGMSVEDIRRIYRGRSLRKYGKNTIIDLDVLIEEVEKIRKQGYAIDDEEFYEGVRCVAAPIRARDKVVASISCTGPVFRMTMKRINSELLMMVKGTADRISQDLRDVTMFG